jgi:hypothetical protein
MLPRPLHHHESAAAPSAPRPMAALAQPNGARAFKVLQSRGAPAQLALFGPPPAGPHRTD